jgi:hypothetical protein
VCIAFFISVSSDEGAEAPVDHIPLLNDTSAAAVRKPVCDQTAGS